MGWVDIHAMAGIQGLFSFGAEGLESPSYGYRRGGERSEPPSSFCRRERPLSPARGWGPLPVGHCPFSELFTSLVVIFQ